MNVQQSCLYLPGERCTGLCCWTCSPVLSCVKDTWKWSLELTCLKSVRYPQGGKTVVHSWEKWQFLSCNSRYSWNSCRRWPLFWSVQWHCGNSLIGLRPKNCCNCKSCGFTRSPVLRQLGNKCSHPQEMCFFKKQPKWLPESSDNTEPYIYIYFFLPTYTYLSSGRTR